MATAVAPQFWCIAFPPRLSGLYMNSSRPGSDPEMGPSRSMVARETHVEVDHLLLAAGVMQAGTRGRSLPERCRAQKAVRSMLDVPIQMHGGQPWILMSCFRQREAGRQAGRQTGRQAGRQAGLQADRQAGRQAP